MKFDLENVLQYAAVSVAVALVMGHFAKQQRKARWAAKSTPTIPTSNRRNSKWRQGPSTGTPPPVASPASYRL